jgi:peptidoglycan/LPS O-acetylase OafA/YrhL
MFFDLIRIAAIAMIVTFHIALKWNIQILAQEYKVLNTFPMGLGEIGVYLLIFVSGAVLALNYPTEKVYLDLRQFYVQRFLRIYPAFWVSMAIPIIVAPAILMQINLSNIVPIGSGFTAFLGMWGGPLNDVYWFIGAIVALYILYPYLSKFIDWNPEISMISLILISYISGWVIIYFNVFPHAYFFTNATRWFPLCNLAVFGAGIYCLRKGLYLKNVATTNIIPYLANLSFFVFLYHYPLLPIANYNICLFVTIVIGISAVAMHIDDHIQTTVTELWKSIPKLFKIMGDE